MFKSFCPRLSRAKDLLPVIRGELVCAATHRSLPLNLSIDLLPIVEDGLFGYEVLPSLETQMYLTIGCNDRGEPMLRRSLYCAAVPSALRLATVNGRFLSQSELDAWHRIEQHDAGFVDWTAAAEATWDDVVTLFPGTLRRSVEFHDGPHRCLDDALAIAHSHLEAWDPMIDFCGVPDEAQYGLALIGADGEHGQLSARSQARWMLRWDSPTGALSEEWAAPAADFGRRAPWARAAMRMGADGVHAAPLTPSGAGATPRAPR
jgi:hypothetical protein